MKKGQVSIFIILGIVIVASIAFLYINQDDSSKDLINTEDFTESKNDKEIVKNYVESCIEKTAIEGIYYISLRGGYYDLPKFNINLFQITQVPYYWFIDSPKTLTKGIIEEELTKYIKDNLPHCINNISYFKELNKYNINYTPQDMELRSSINKKDLTINLNYPILLNGKDQTYKIDSFYSKIEIDFNQIIEIINMIVSEQSKTPDYFPLGFITKLAYEKNFKFDLENLKESKMILTIFFNFDNKDFFNKNLIFNIGFKYLWSYNNHDNEIRIEHIPLFNVNDSQNFEYKINALGEGLVFIDFSEEIEIDPVLGIIKTNTSLLDEGQSSYLILVQDLFDNEYYTSITFNKSIGA